MGYLILGFCASALVSVVMRLSEQRAKNGVGLLAVNYAVCALLGMVTAGLDALLPGGPGQGLALGLGCLNGGIYLGAFLLFQFNVRRNGVVLSATFMKLGLLVNLLISVLIFRERPGMGQIIGFCLAVGAIMLMNYRPGTGAARQGWLLGALLLAGGMADGMSKIFEEAGPAGFSEQFLLYTFATALVLCLILAAVKKQLPGKWEILWGAAIGIPNYYSSRFLLMALKTVPGVIAYPVYSVAGILVVTLAGVLLFRERLERRQWLALGIILAALVLLN